MHARRVHAGLDEQRVSPCPVPPKRADLTVPTPQPPFVLPRPWMIWGLVAAVAVTQAAVWLVAGGGAFGPAGVIQVTASWIVTLVLAVLASRRIGTLRHRLTEKEDAHRATLDEVEQLQIQNAML